jgi:hypothetical protein
MWVKKCGIWVFLSLAYLAQHDSLQFHQVFPTKGIISFIFITE